MYSFVALPLGTAPWGEQRIHEVSYKCFNKGDKPLWLWEIQASIQNYFIFLCTAQRAENKPDWFTHYTLFELKEFILHVNPQRCHDIRECKSGVTTTWSENLK